MSVRGRIIFMAVFLGAFWLPGSSPAAVAPAAGMERSCQSCHDDELFRVRFGGSVHGNNSCTSCHTDIRNLAAHMSGKEKPATVNCGSCHQEIAKDFRENFHYLQEDFRCTDCHRGIHALKKADANFKLAVIRKCTECHAHEEYAASGHAEAVLRGNQDSADCSDCHGLHDTRVYHTSLEAYSGEAREFYTQKCKSCHSDRKMMERSEVNPDMVRNYEATYHGKVENIGYPSRVAGCGDCHSTHNILPKRTPARASIRPTLSGPAVAVTRGSIPASWRTTPIRTTATGKTTRPSSGPLSSCRDC